MEHYDICIICVPEDTQIANTLADSLRKYRLPKGTVPAEPGLDYRKIYVDNSGSDFDDSVKMLLDHSRYLIVICSPLAKPSTAIRARIVYFRHFRRDEDVIAVIVRGEPIDSFPELFIEKKMVQHIMPDMRIVEREETIEPVASDLRGDTPARRRQLLRYETVRITASVLGLHPDALEQRHRKRRKQAIAAAAAVVSTVFLTASGIFLRLGYIARKEGQIAEQQTALSMEAADRLVMDLPAMFDNDPRALNYINEAIAEAKDALDSITSGDEVG